MHDLTWWQAVLLATAAMAAVFGGRLIGGWAHRALYRRVLATHTTNDERLVARMAGPLYAVSGALLWHGIITFLDLPAEALGFCRTLGHVALLVAIAWGAMRAIDTGFDLFVSRSPWLSDQRAAKALLPLARGISKGVLAAMIGVMILSRMGYAVGPLLVLFAIVGGAVALAAHRPLENVLAAYAIAGDHGIREGDLVRLDSGIAGVIEAIGLYSTRIRTPTSSHVIVPNRKLADAQVERAIQRPSRVVIPTKPSNGATTEVSTSNGHSSPSRELS